MEHPALKMKITDKDSLIEAQYSVLLKVEELNYLSNDEHSCIERNKIKELAFAALISMNAEGIFQKEENIFFRNILMPKVIFFEKYPFLRNKVLDLPIYKENTDQTLNEEQCTNNETSDVIVIEDEAKAVFKDMARNTDGVFNEDKEPEKGIQETSEKIKQAEGSEQVNIPDETDTVPQSRLIYDKYRLEDSIMEHHETEYAKFLDTMWFNIFHITCNVKDGFMPENFTIIVFPTEIAKDRRPLSQAVALLHDNSKKIIFSNKKTGTSVEINYEDYMFAITSRFVDGKLNTKISLANREYEITDMEEENFSGNIIPEHFGKNLYFEDDKVEIYPLNTTNNEQSGCVSFMYKFTESGKTTYGTSEEDDSVVIAIKKGGAKRISCYWVGQDSERRLNFVVD